MVAETAKGTEKAEWKAFPLETYRQAAAALVHFSAKGVNSNAEPFGVRLGRDDGLALPYVSVRCLMAQGAALAVDYAKNPGGESLAAAGETAKTADVYRQIRQLQAGEHGQAEETAAPLLAAIAEALAVAHADPEGLRQVSPRLRQVLLPKDGDYVALTPLPCAGLSREINRRVRQHNEAAKEARKNGDAASPRQLPLAGLGVGGSNPQNVGALVREMQTALAFDAPKEHRAIRLAFAIHHRGIPIALPRRLMLAWHDWRHRAMAENGGVPPTDMAARQAEQAHVEALARAVLRQGEKAWRVLEAWRDILPDAAPLSPELSDAVMRGLIDPGERGKDWPRCFGERVAEAVGRYAAGLDARERLIALDSASLHRIARWVEELAR